MVDVVLILIILLALIFDFVNGFHDTANAIATSVMTNAIKIPYAIMMAAALNFLGAIMSTHVAETIGKSIVDPSTITQTVIVSTLISAITWNIITWKYGLPSSSSHALIGSLMGVVLIQGIALKLEGVKVIIIALIISPLMGLIGGIVIMILFYRIFRNIRVEKINRIFRKVQIASAAFMAISHGGNDAQKSMGIIAMALMANNLITGHFYVPTWVKISCALAMAFGTAAGGWKIIKTVGRGIIELKPIQGCAAETISATVIQLATHVGLPVSTTHVVTSAICGAGAAENIYNVNWNVMKNIVLAWFFTIPFVAIFAAVIFKVIHFLQTVMH
ncbi:MAG: anion permease [Vulcanimicrobiota bacterium]